MPTRQDDLPNRRSILQIQRFALAATLNYMIGEFNRGYTAAHGHREQPLLVVIPQERNSREVSGARRFWRAFAPASC
jgi:hypothetical protein